jgi:hypothetical protein
MLLRVIRRKLAAMPAISPKKLIQSWRCCAKKSSTSGYLSESDATAQEA